VTANPQPDKAPPPVPFAHHYPSTEIGRTWGKFVVFYEPVDYSTMRQKSFRYEHGDEDSEAAALTEAKRFARTTYQARIDRFVQEIIDFKGAG
jgi:hypothetical protein